MYKTNTKNEKEWEIVVAYNLEGPLQQAAMPRHGEQQNAVAACTKNENSFSRRDSHRLTAKHLRRSHTSSLIGNSFRVRNGNTKTAWAYEETGIWGVGVGWLEAVANSIMTEGIPREIG